MSRILSCVLPLVVALVVVLAGCTAESPSKPAPSAALAPFVKLEGTLDIAGGTAHIPVMTEAAKRIMTANPAIRVTVAGGGSGVGVQKVGEGLVQIGNAGRALSEDERTKYGLVSFPFAVDGVCAVVHGTNPVNNLTSAQLKALFTGEIKRWSEVGGPDLDVNLYARDEASGTRKVFWKKALARAKVARGANIVPSNGAMKTAVAADPGALGYISIGHVDASLKALALDGTEPTQENAKSGAFPVTRKLYMNTKGEPAGLTRAFIDYVLGPDCAGVIADKGYIPLTK